MSDAHAPVLLQEVIDGLAVRRDGVYVDATFGRGGYTREMLKAGAKEVIGIDRDPDAVAASAELAKEFPQRFRMLHGPFSELKTLLADAQVTQVDGIAFDLGVSSPQLDNAERGFSFRQDGPLDMRMSADGESAADMVNNMGEEELANIIYQYGEERASRRIAKAIVTQRAEQPFTRTSELAALVAKVVPKRDDTHPATKTFQALRIAVNDELGELKQGLQAAVEVLSPQGRLAVVTFHSLEDRIVKDFFRKQSGQGETVSRHRPMLGARPVAVLSLVNKKAIAPSAAETARNTRARSAKLRVAEKLNEARHAA